MQRFCERRELSRSEITHKACVLLWIEPGRRPSKMEEEKCDSTPLFKEFLCLAAVQKGNGKEPY